MHTKLTSILLPTAAALALCAGCDSAAPLFPEDGSGDLAGTTAPLSVEMESASGTLFGQLVTPEMFEPTGVRFGEELNFHLAIPSDGLELFVVTSQTESSSVNPYTGEGTDPGGREARPPSDDPSGVGTGVAAAGIHGVMLCDNGGCTGADDFVVEVVQTADGRLAVVDGSWSGLGDAIVTFRYTESR